MDRYQFQRPKVKKDKKRIQGQTIYPAILPRVTDLYIVVRDGQRMDTLANEYYGSPSMWWIIAQANNITGGTLFLKPGSSIRIPKDLATIQRELEKANTER